MEHRHLHLGALFAVLGIFTLTSCDGDGGTNCTEIDCSSSVEVGYGLSVAEPYLLTIDPMGMKGEYLCLPNTPDPEPLPEWLRCDATGFQIEGEFADITSLSVTVTPLSAEDALISGALVSLSVVEEMAPNGPDCEPICYLRAGSVGS